MKAQTYRNDDLFVSYSFPFFTEKIFELGPDPLPSLILGFLLVADNPPPKPYVAELRRLLSFVEEKRPAAYEP